MFLQFGHLIGILCSAKIVSARFCEGGHICSLPRECCTQGCCPPYQSGPRQLPPASDHVLNLFFISHWYFWCVVVAIILAILCAYSLWKKRRTLCGWGLAEHHAQSEGDSAGSCYAPPQYSRCNSFHHPPPPYTEVTSKPDLYPLVFTCNSDNGKNGASYLMVQYFRNYIVRPAGSLSATSTVDSLSSSFICNANEANTLVPPPYSRATSPEIGFSSHFQQHYMIPRSASQLVCATAGQDIGNGNGNGNLATQQVYQSSRGGGSLYTTSTLNGAAGGVPNSMALTLFNTGQLRMPESSIGNLPYSTTDVAESAAESAAGNRNSRSVFVQSQSDQHFKYIANSNSSISDIFVNNCAPELGLAEMQHSGESNNLDDDGGDSTQNAQATHTSHVLIGGTPAIYSNGCIQTNPLHKPITSPKQLVGVGRNPVYNSSSSIGGISITLPLRMHEFTKKCTEEALRSYVTSGTCSAVSSLANIGTPSSPPQATSPTGEVKEILDQIRQLQTGATCLEARPQLLHSISSPSPTKIKHYFADLQRFPSMRENHCSVPEKSSPPKNVDISIADKPTAKSTKMHNLQTSSKGAANFTANSTATITSLATKRPSTLQQSKKKFFAPLKPNKAMYIPMMATNTSSSMSTTTPSRSSLKSPVSSVVSANFFSARGRVRKSWISRSAPTTPGTGLPPDRLGDDSPLLNEHDEDLEAEHNVEDE